MAIVIRPGTSTAPPPPAPTPTPVPSPTPVPPAFPSGTSAPTSARSSDGYVGVRTDPAYLGVRVDVVWPAAGTGLVSVVRIGADNVQVVVRGANRTNITNGFAVAYDSEAPLGVPVTYYARREDTGVFSQGATVQTADPGISVLKPIGFPGLVAPFRVATLPDFTRDRAAQVVRVYGRPDPVVVADVRSTVAFDLGVYVSASQLPGLRVVLARSLTFLLQTSQLQSVGLLGDYFCAVTSDSEKFTTPKVQGGDRFLTLHVVEVARPSTVGSPLRIPGQAYRDETTTIGKQIGSYRQQLLA